MTSQKFSLHLPDGLVIGKQGSSPPDLIKHMGSATLFLHLTGKMGSGKADTSLVSTCYLYVGSIIMGIDFLLFICSYLV